MTVQRVTHRRGSRLINLGNVGDARQLRGQCAAAGECAGECGEEPTICCGADAGECGGNLAEVLGQGPKPGEQCQSPVRSFFCASCRVRFCEDFALISLDLHAKAVGIQVHKLSEAHPLVSKRPCEIWLFCHVSTSQREAHACCASSHNHLQQFWYKSLCGGATLCVSWRCSLWHCLHC